MIQSNPILVIFTITLNNSRCLLQTDDPTTYNVSLQNIQHEAGIQRLHGLQTAQPAKSTGQMQWSEGQMSMTMHVRWVTDHQ
jgi:P pilus assembly chaperone PapD